MQLRAHLACICNENKYNNVTDIHKARQAQMPPDAVIVALRLLWPMARVSKAVTFTVCLCTREKLFLTQVQCNKAVLSIARACTIIFAL